VHGDKELIEKLGRNDPCSNDPAPAAPRVGFKNCCLRDGQFDGSDRNHFFQASLIWHDEG